jgi:hypothetical protein
VVEDVSNFPKEIVNIIREYTFVLPREQYKEKYSRTQLFRAYCIDKEWESYDGRIDSSCNHLMMNQPGDPQGKKLPKKCTRTKQELGWRPTEFSIHNCRKCNNIDGNSYIVPEGHSINGRTLIILNNNRSNKNFQFDACYVCDKIDFCPSAEKDDEICLMKFQCFLCEEFTCDHGIRKQVAPGSLLCTSCQQTFKKVNFLKKV